MQTVFFASVAHDLRTPLNSMLASCNSLLTSQYLMQRQDIVEKMNLQKNSILFLMSLVEDVLDISRI